MKLSKVLSPAVLIPIAVAIAAALVSALAVRWLPFEKETIDKVTAVFDLISKVFGLIGATNLQVGSRDQEQHSSESVSPIRGWFQRQPSRPSYYQEPSFSAPFLLMESTVTAQAPRPTAAGWKDLLRTTAPKIPSLLLMALAASFALIGLSTVFAGQITAGAVVKVYWGIVIIFALFGVLYGWGVAIIMAFGELAALSLMGLVQAFSPTTLMGNPEIPGSSLNFILQTCILFFTTLLAFQFMKMMPPRVNRLPDSFLGIISGAMLGYFIAGMLLFLLVQAGFDTGWTGSGADKEILQNLRTYSPQNVLAGGGVYAALIISLIFVVVVLI